VTISVFFEDICGIRLVGICKSPFALNLSGTLDDLHDIVLCRPKYGKEDGLGDRVTDDAVDNLAYFVLLQLKGSEYLVALSLIRVELRIQDTIHHR
jgi:hypothetical protein